MKGEQIEVGGSVAFIDGPDAYGQKITVNGRVWQFDHDERFGPLWLKKDGTSERKCQNPGKRVWEAFANWVTGYEAFRAGIQKESK